MNKRQKPCRAATHHCNSCNKELSSANSLWNHKQICRKESDGGVRSFDASDTSLKKVIKHPIDSVAITINQKGNQENKTLPTHCTPSDYQEMDKDDGSSKLDRATNVDLILQKLKLIADLIVEGHKDLHAAYRAVVEELLLLGVLSDDQYKSLRNVVA